MWMTRIALNRPVTIMVFVVAILVLGYYALGKMQVELQPKVDFPVITIVTPYPGASPEEVETLISKPIEDAVAGVEGLRQITSTSQFSLSQVALEFYIGTDISQAYIDVQAKVNTILGQLPEGAERPTILKLDTQSQPTMYLSLTGNRPPYELRDLAENIIKDRLSSVPGVAAVSVAGGQKREIQVAVDKRRLNAYGLSINTIVRTLQGANLNVPAGRITEGERDYNVRLLGEFKSVDELRNLEIYLPNPRNPMQRGSIVRLKDVADVRDTVEERTELTRVNGKEDVSIVIQKTSDGNAIEVSDGVKAQIARIQQEYPDLQFTITQDTADAVKESLADLRLALGIAIVLVVVIIYLFLYNVRGAIIVSLAIPTCFFAAFIAMYFFGFTINFMTMLALSLAVGVLVDDAIVVIENIYRHLSLGEEPMEAAYNGRTEIGLAAVTITFVDVVVFLPIAFMGGVTGQFFRSFGITVAVTVLFSLIVSFTLTPMLASRLYRRGEALEEPRGFFKWFDTRLNNLKQSYRHALAWSLRHRWLVILTANGALVATFVLIIGSAVAGSPLLPFRFAPSQDQGLIQVTIEMPPDAALSQTDAAAQRIEQAALTIPEVKYVATRLGRLSSGFFGGGDTGPRFASMQITLHEKKALLDSLLFWVKHDERLRTRRDIEIAAELRQKIGDIPGAQVVVNAVSGFRGGGFGAPIQIALVGKDTATLLETAERVRNLIAQIPGIKDPDLSWSAGKPELQVRVDREKATALGVNLAEIAAALRTAYEGDTSVKYREAGQEYDVRVRLREDQRQRLTGLNDLVVAYVQGAPVYLRDVATITLGEGPTKIERTDRQRRITVTANLLPGYTTGNMRQVIDAKLRETNAIPPGVRAQWFGENEVLAREGVYMAQALLLALILVYLLMVALFENWLYPFIIMFSQPQALVGALLALVLFRSELNIISMIGIIALVGIVGKNAILLVDYTNTLRQRGLARDEALLEAGETRMRPILMTTLSLVLAMIPIALAVGRGSEFRAPLGIVILGGLTVSTLLTLIVIPCTYSVVDDFTRFLSRVIWKRGAVPIEQAAVTKPEHEEEEVRL
ncbi:MAG: multidrug transporter [Armatimonadetes bacterium JP3_11]|jgi:HAE1 family hydrophobic/amphiphilic exporter-1|nr:MAG: multidrug transporter [Armatimonadetes bacterium JP3_11]